MFRPLYGRAEVFLNPYAIFDSTAFSGRTKVAPRDSATCAYRKPKPERNGDEVHQEPRMN